MIALIVTAGVVLGAAALALLAWRARRAGHAGPSVQDDIERVRRKLATIKVAHDNGRLAEAAYHDQRRQLTEKMIELARTEPVAKGRRTGLFALGSLAAAGLALGAGLLIWPVLRPAGGDVPQSASVAASAAHPLSADQLERTVAKMRERVKQDPKDATAWAMLAHSYGMLGRHTEASASYTQLIELVPTDPQVLVDAADSLALTRGRQLQGEPMQLIQRALTIDPKNLKALSLAGTDALERGDPAQAIAYWQRARAQVADAALALELDSRIAEARALQARPVSIAAAASARAVAPNPTAFVSGRIVLAKSLKAQISPDDALFVFARPVDGTRMPVALMRRRANELPIEFRLDDSMAMVPQARLSGQPRVIVGARISKRGDASPQAGDLQGFSAPVAVGTQGLRVEISETVK